MAIEHAVSGQAFGVRPLGTGLAAARTSAIFKSKDLELMHLVLLSGKGLPSHRVDGEITIQCIEGRLKVSADGREQVLEAGDMVFLAGGMPHAVDALADSSALVTVALLR